jgi:hypothetical protein
VILEPPRAAIDASIDPGAVELSGGPIPVVARLTAPTSTIRALTVHGSLPCETRSADALTVLVRGPLWQTGLGGISRCRRIQVIDVLDQEAVNFVRSLKGSEKT